MAGRRLTHDERLQIEALWRVGQSIPRIAEVIGRDRSTVWRELKRNHSYRHGFKHPGGRHSGVAGGRGPGLGGLYRWGYLAGRAREWATARARRPKRAKLAVGQPLRAEVLARLRQRHSPRQI